MGEVISTSWLILDDAEKEELKKKIENIEIYSASFAGNELEKNFLIDL
jgi:hypothetical protein